MGVFEGKRVLGPSKPCGFSAKPGSPNEGQVPGLTNSHRVETHVADLMDKNNSSEKTMATTTTMTQTEQGFDQELQVESGRPWLAAIVIVLAVAFYLNADIEKRRTDRPAAKLVVQRNY